MTSTWCPQDVNRACDLVLYCVGIDETMPRMGRAAPPPNVSLKLHATEVLELLGAKATPLMLLTSYQNDLPLMARPDNLMEWM
eukprot:5907472-Amphidinium_carterae.1